MSETAETIFALGAALALIGGALAIGAVLSREWDIVSHKLGFFGLLLLLASLPMCTSTVFY